MYFLTINAGSSSIKFSLFDADSLTEEYTGKLSGIGFDSANFSLTGKKQQDRKLEAADHATALSIITEWLEENVEAGQISAISHRVVHGGPDYTEPCFINEKVIADLQNLASLDPVHMPIQLGIINQLHQLFPDVPGVACFDTAFFHDLPTESRLLPLPRRLEAGGMRRYGFHGLSYAYLLAEFEKAAGAEAAKGKIVFAHLGNGASLAAVNQGKPVDTTMGLTPAGGIPMSSRSGDLDPGVITYLSTQAGLSPQQVERMLYLESGLLGISGVSADMKELLELESDNPAAKDAVDVFCYNVRKSIGAYAAALGGLNSLVFSGGIGEASAAIRERACQGLEFLGIELNAERNQSNADLVSADGAKVGVHVIPTNEALTIARQTRHLTSQKE